MPKKTSADSFKSIQILSAKAQSLWTKAKMRMKAAEDGKFTRSPLPPEPKGRTGNLIDVSGFTVFKVMAIIILMNTLAAVIFIIRDKILLLFLALFLALIMDSHVRRLERWRIPRGIAVVVIYLIFLAAAILLLASLIPIVATQIQDLARLINTSADSFLADPHVRFGFLSTSMNERLTELMQQGLQSMGIKDRASALFQFGQSLSTVAQSSINFAVQTAGSVVNFILNLILILFLALFIQLEREKLGDFIRVLLPRTWRSYYDTKADAIHKKVSQWFQGQLILCVSIGVLVFIALMIMGEPLSQYALTLGLLAGFTEFIPYVGPIIAAVPAIFIAVSEGNFFLALIVMVVYYVIQMCENNLLVPIIMKHAVGLSPIAIMFGMLVGISFPSTVHPILGIILAVPTTAVITIFVQDYYALRRRK